MKQSDFFKLQIENFIIGLTKESALRLLTRLQTKQHFFSDSIESASILVNRKKIFNRIADFLNNPLDKSSLTGWNNEILEEETNSLEIVESFLEEKINSLAKRGSGYFIRPTYPTSWIEFETKVGLSSNMEQMNKVDLCRTQQILANKPTNGFYRIIYFQILDETQKQQFEAMFPLKYKWLLYETKAQFNPIQLEKIDAIIHEVEEKNELPINYFRKILLDKDLLGQRNNDNQTVETQLAFFREIFPSECKWLFFEDEAQNLERFSREKWALINAQLSKLCNKEINDYTFSKQIYKHKRLLSIEQKVIFLRHYPQLSQDKSTINELVAYKGFTNTSLNHSRKQTKISATQSYHINMDTVEKEKTFDSNVTHKRKNQKPDEDLHKKQKKQVEMQSLVFPMNEIDIAINNAVQTFTLQFRGTNKDTTGLQKVQTIDNMKYLKNVIIISPPATLTESEREQFGNKVMKRVFEILKAYNLCYDNILLVTKDPDWKNNNLYKKKNGKPIALTIPENTPIGTVVIRGRTTTTFAERLQNINTNPLSTSSQLKMALSSTTTLVSQSLSKTFQNNISSSGNNLSLGNNDGAAAALMFFAQECRKGLQQQTSDSTINNTTAEKTNLQPSEPIDILDSIFDIETDPSKNVASNQSEREILISKIKTVQGEIKKFEEELEQLNKRQMQFK